MGEKKKKANKQKKKKTEMVQLIIYCEYLYSILKLKFGILEFGHLHTLDIPIFWSIIYGL